MKIALIGLGVMGKNHYLELCKKGVKLACFDIYKPDFISDEHYCASIDELLDADGAIIAVPTKYHYEIFSKISQKIKYILIEKPLSFSLDEAMLIKNSSINVAVGFCERFNPVSLAMKEFCADEKIEYAYFLRGSAKPERISDVGVDMDLSVHDIDLASFFGIRKKLNITRSGSPCTQIKLRSDSLEITASWHFKARIRKAFINTNKASYELDFLRKQLLRNEQEIAILNHSSLAAEQESFINYIKTGNLGLLASADDAIYTQQVLQN